MPKLHRMDIYLNATFFFFWRGADFIGNFIITLQKPIYYL